MLHRKFFFTLWLSLFLGCAPGIRVVKNPGDDDKGVRYYRPKPYLMVTTAQKTHEDNVKKTTEMDHRFVMIEIKYLPDFSEEYSISTTAGIGTAHVEITLGDGWNLTSINQNLDSKTQENIQAATQLATAVLSGGAALTDQIQCAASNVPIGLYESVIERDKSGRKQLIGWRYIGFSLCGAPAMQSRSGGASAGGSGSGDLYGLVWDNHKNMMAFRRLSNLECQTSDEHSAGALRCALEQRFLQWKIGGLTPRVVCVDVDSASQRLIVLIQTTENEDSILEIVTQCIQASASSLSSHELCLKIVRPVESESNAAGVGHASL